MPSPKAKKHRIWVAVAVLFWLAVGVAVPLMFDFTGDELQLDNAGVIAAPRDSFQIAGSLLIDEASRTIITGGTLAMASPKNTKPLTAEDAATLLDSGRAVLLLDRTTIRVSAPASTIRSAQSSEAAPLARALQTGKFKTLGIRNGTLMITLPNGHREQLTRAKMNVMPNGNGTIEAKGEGFWRGQRGKFTLKTLSPVKSGSVSLSMTFNGTLLNISYNGDVELSGEHAVRGTATAHLKNTEKLANALGTTWPIGTHVQDIRIEGPLRWEQTILAFDDAKVSVGGNLAKGTVSLDTAEGKAQISSTLAFSKLDIAPYLPSGSIDHTALAWQWWSKMVATLSQPSAPHINADIRLSTQTLSSAGLALGPTAATISMRNGKLSVDVAELTLQSGRATGQLSVDFNRYIPKLVLRGQLEEVETAELSEAITGARLISGKGRIIADLTSHGVSVEQIVNDLSGTAEFALPEGGKVAVALDQLTTSSQSPATSEQLAAKALRGATLIKGFEATWKIKDGIASINKTLGEYAGGHVKMSGSYDLARHSYSFRSLVVASPLEAPQKIKLDTNGKPAAAKTNKRPTPPLRTRAMLVAIKSPKVASTEVLNRPQAPEFQLNTLTGLLSDLEKTLGPGYPKQPRRGL